MIWPLPVKILSIKHCLFFKEINFFCFSNKPKKTCWLVFLIMIVSPEYIFIYFLFFMVIGFCFHFGNMIPKKGLRNCFSPSTCVVVVFFFKSSLFWFEPISFCCCCCLLSSVIYLGKTNTHLRNNNVFQQKKNSDLESWKIEAKIDKACLNIDQFFRCCCCWFDHHHHFDQIIT